MFDFDTLNFVDLDDTSPSLTRSHADKKGNWPIHVRLKGLVRQADRVPARIGFFLLLILLPR